MEHTNLQKFHRYIHRGVPGGRQEKRIGRRDGVAAHQLSVVLLASAAPEGSSPRPAPAVEHGGRGGEGGEPVDDEHLEGDLHDLDGGADPLRPDGDLVPVSDGVASVRRRDAFRQRFLVENCCRKKKRETKRFNRWKKKRRKQKRYGSFNSAPD